MNTKTAILTASNEESLTFSIDGEVQEIRHQLSELKELLANQDVQSVQYADKIYNIKHIDEANFGFLTGKKAFNEALTKSLLEVMQTECVPAQKFMERVKAIPHWESQLRISNKAKEIIAYSFVGILGIQLSKLMAIGKEDFSESKQTKYIGKCLHIASYALGLLNFTLLSALWDRQHKDPVEINEASLLLIEKRFEHTFEHSLPERFQLLVSLYQLFSEHKIPWPLEEFATLAPQMQADSELANHCNTLAEINDRLDKAQYSLLDCYEAEQQLAHLLGHLVFLVKYEMASIKKIGYRQLRNDKPHYLHRYAALGIDSKANVDAEKLHYTSDATFTDAVLLFKGDDYQESINLFPFVIDYNALTFEQGAKICFFNARHLEDQSLEYLFLEDRSIIHLEASGLQYDESDYNELMIDNKKHQSLNLDDVVAAFAEAKKTILQEIDFGDL
jgi:hypothetical protein